MKVIAKFVTTDGVETTATFDENGTVVDGSGRSGTFSRADNKLTISGAGQELTITAKDPIKLEPGFQTTYTASTGKSGTVSIVSVG